MTDRNKLEKVFADESLVELFSKLDAYDFKYKEQIDDDREYIGVMAQQLESNPITEQAVIEDENGIKGLDTHALVSVDTAVLTDVCKRLLALEEKVYGNR